MRVRPLVIGIFAIVLAGAAVGGGTLLGRSLSASPPASPRVAPQLQIAEGNFPITFQGILLDENGVPVPNGGQSVTFSIYNDPAVNASLWRETQTVFTLDGLFTAELGVEEEIDPEIFSSNPETWLGIRVGFNPEMTPRIRLAYAPYALHAVTAENLTSPQPNFRQVALLRWYEANETNIRVPVGDAPSAVAYDGEHIWVANRGDPDETDDDVLTKINAVTGRRVADFEVGTNPVAIAFDGENIWVANRDSNDITRFRTDGVGLTTIPLPPQGSRPVDMAFDGTNMWVVSQGSNNVIKFNARNPLNDSEVVPAGNNLAAIAFDGNLIWITQSGSSNIRRIDPSNNTLVDTLSVGGGQADIVFDGNSMWIANSSNNSVTKVRTSDGTELGTFDVGGRPLALAFDGRAIWVVNNDTDDITKLRVADGSEIGVFSAGGSPAGIAFDGAYMWVTSQSTDSVIKK
jgi:hypothetical protein